MPWSARYAAFTFAMFACACGNDGSSAATSGGVGGAGGGAGTGGAGPELDSGTDATGVDDVADVGDSMPTITVLVDDIFGGTMVDGGTFVPQWPVRYAFDTGLDGWEIAPPTPDEVRPVEAIVHSDEDARGATDSGSLGLRTWFEPYATDSSWQTPTVVRAFSSESGPPKNWEGYGVVAKAKLGAGSTACSVHANLYALAGTERLYLNSRIVNLSRQEWRPLLLDLESYRTFGDTTQIVEFGVEITHEVCIPP